MAEQYREIVNPSPVEILMAGDRVVMEWDLYQTGTWFISYQVAKIEAMFERDGRVELLSYTYNPEAKTLAFKMQIKSNNIGQTNIPALASSLGPLAIGVLVLSIFTLAGLIVGAVSHFMYEKTRRDRLFRKAGPAVAERLGDPDVSEEEKEVLQRGMEADEVTMSEAAQSMATAVIVVVGAVVLFKVMGAFK